MYIWAELVRQACSLYVVCLLRLDYSSRTYTVVCAAQMWKFLFFAVWLFEIWKIYTSVCSHTLTSSLFLDLSRDVCVCWEVWIQPWPRVRCLSGVCFCVLAERCACRTTERFVLRWGRSGCCWVENWISGSASCMCDDDDDDDNNNDDDNNEFSCTGVYLNLFIQLWIFSLSIR